MKNNYPLVSIVIATFNSAHLLPKVLLSIRKQTYPQQRIEIIVVDGGSNDDTAKIAKLYKCRIINNPKVFPVFAKYIGYLKAKGKYLMFLDSDEMICNKDSIKIKVATFQNNPQVHAITGNGYISPLHYSFVNQYINEFGDPFSFFMYKLSKDSRFYIPMMNKYYKRVKQTHEYNVYDFNKFTKNPIIELVAMGSMVDLLYLKRNFPSIKDNPDQIPHLFNLLISKNSYLAIIKNDPLIHYSANTFNIYLGKIISRVVNNIFSNADEGFKGREKLSKNFMVYKKYLFIPYSYSLIFPFIDSLYLIVTRKQFGYLLHVLFSLITASFIIYFSIRKMFGYKPVPRNYGLTLA